MLECGVVTPDARRTLPPVNVAVAVIEYAWPFAIIAVGGIMVIGPIGMSLDLAPMGLVTVVIGLCLTPIAAAFTTVRLMRRMPHRMRWAPLVLLLPRIVAVPILVAAASAVVAGTMTFGGCLVGLSFFRS